MGLTFGLPSSKDVRAAIGKLARLSLEAPSSWGEPHSDARWRWAVDVDRWFPAGGASGEEFRLLLRLLPEGQERAGVERLPNFRDRKRSLLGRLLARRACARALGVEEFDGLEFGRTYGGKPFLLRPLPGNLPNFNFNISHDGRWVVLASDPLRVVGADVAAPQRERGDPEDDSWFDDLSSLLLDSERSQIQRETTIRRRYAVFQRLWSAKEAITKGTGEGVQFGFERISITLDGADAPTIDDWFSAWLGEETPEPTLASGDLAERGGSAPSAHAEIDEWPCRWDLEQHVLPDSHWVTFASGPIEEVVDRVGDFSATLRLPCIDEEARRRAQVRAPPRLEILEVPALVPPGIREAYQAARQNTVIVLGQ